MNKRIIIFLVLLIILIWAILVISVYLINTNELNANAPVESGNQTPLIINSNQNTNINISLPVVTAPASQDSSIINADTNDRQSDSQAYVISISNLAFNPKTLKIKIGSTVTWINDDPAPHIVIGQGFVSLNLFTGDSYSFTFTQAGTYDYHCAIHPSMTGQIIVQ